MPAPLGQLPRFSSRVLVTGRDGIDLAGALSSAACLYRISRTARREGATSRALHEPTSFS